MDSTSGLELAPAHLILIGAFAGSIVTWVLLFLVKLLRVSRDSKGEIEMIKWLVILGDYVFSNTSVAAGAAKSCARALLSFL
jgi:hypothetical protein